MYKAALERHVDAFWDGEDLAEDSKVHHLAHAMACIALMLDSISLGIINDDRPPPGTVAELQKTFAKTKEIG